MQVLHWIEDLPERNMSSATPANMFVKQTTTSREKSHSCIVQPNAPFTASGVVPQNRIASGPDLSTGFLVRLSRIDSDDSSDPAGLEHGIGTGLADVHADVLGLGRNIYACITTAAFEPRSSTSKDMEWVLYAEILLDLGCLCP